MATDHAPDLAMRPLHMWCRASLRPRHVSVRHRAQQHSAAHRTVTALAMALLATGAGRSAAAQRDSTVLARGDSVTIRLVDVDLRLAVQSLGQYLDRPVLFGAVNGGRVTVETPRPIPRRDVLRLLRGVVESQNLEFMADTAAGLYRVRPKDVAPSTPQTAFSGARGAGASSGGSGGGPELFVIRLRHARATNVAAMVNALYGRATAFGELGGGRGGTLDQSLRQNVVPPQIPGQVGSGPQGDISGGRLASLTGETTIVPDPGTNSLLVRANRADYELIQAAVRELDVRPLQVLIEVLIAEVRRDRALDFGVDATVPDSRLPGVPNATGGLTTVGSGVGDFVFKIMRHGPGLDIDATLRAAASRGDARIISRPVIIAANNEAAEILVGSQRPFVQVSRSLPTDSPTRDQVVQYKDVGTRLKVRPTISGDGYVALSVTQEVNNATAETQFDAPVISTRTVDTHLLVRDSQTVVLGGLADRQREVTQAGVPVLSSIPVLGGLFGRTTRRTADVEFFLFITPRIIRSDQEADRVTSPFERRTRVEGSMVPDSRGVVPPN